MGRYLLFLAIFALVGFSYSNSNDRIQSDIKAKDAFLHLNFFAEGRGMHLVPGLIEVFENFYQTKTGLGLRDSLLHDRWGFNIENHWPVGLFDEEFKGMRIGALGCVACHSGRAAGKLILGLGNKNIDVFAIGRDAGYIENIFQDLKLHHRTDSDYLAVRDSALQFAKLLSNGKIGNTTQGMVPVSFIRAWFYKSANLQLPQELTRGAVKVPSLWGYGEKRKLGQFSDGYGNGDLPGWAIAVELTGGQEPQTVRSYLPKIEAAENLFSDFLPPKYPFEINSEKASQGKIVFEKTCVKCHGSYQTDNESLPIYEGPKWIPLSIVKTDDDRLSANTPFFNHLVETGPLNDVIKHTDLGRGYFAPRLVGIWSRFPYLHNGSIPNVLSLLTPPAQRPKVFSVRDAGEEFRFDKANLGLTTENSPQREAKSRMAPEVAELSARTRYDTQEVGHSNLGHSFGTTLSREEKSQLIEYLKTL